MEANAFRRAFPNTPIFGFFGRGEIGVTHLPKFPRTEGAAREGPAPKRRKRRKAFHQFSTIIVLLSFLWSRRVSVSWEVQMFVLLYICHVFLYGLHYFRKQKQVGTLLLSFLSQVCLCLWSVCSCIHRSSSSSSISTCTSVLYILIHLFLYYFGGLWKYRILLIYHSYLLEETESHRTILYSRKHTIYLFMKDGIEVLHTKLGMDDVTSGLTV